MSYWSLEVNMCGGPCKVPHPYAFHLCCGQYIVLLSVLQCLVHSSGVTVPRSRQTVLH